jgi:AcrR family transcriptional regulator
MEDIAAEAGYAASSLYTYFKGKDELVHSLIAAVRAQFDEVKNAPLLERLPFPERLHWLVAHNFAVVEKNRDFFAMMYAHRGSFEVCGNGALESSARQGHQRWLEFFTSFLRSGMAEGAVRRGDARQLASVIVGAMQATVMGWVLGDDAAPLASRAAPLCEFVMHGIGRAGKEQES